jgi:cysteine desulfurase / selenocysteine lyase
MMNINKIREDFPVLKKTVYGHPLVYFDNAATTQKPRIVIDTMNQFQSESYSSIHRGVHYLSEQATEVYEASRKTVQTFINADFSQEVIFTSGTTGSINAVAFSFGERYIKKGDEILITAMEHHANIVPWQMMCERKQARLKVIPFDNDGILNMAEFEKLLTRKVKLVAVTHVSNALGTVNPVKQIIDKAHHLNIPVLIDGAQSIQHHKIDVQQLDCDFYAFSGHKIYGPTGIGILYGKERWLNELPPYQGGGEMVSCVTFEKTSYNELPFKFEAGTTNFVAAIGLAEAIKYVDNIGIENIASWEQELLKYADLKLKGIEGLRIYGNAPEKGPVISFLLDNIHYYDAGMILDKLGIAVRTGGLCAHPVMDFFEMEGTIRASFAFYNTKEEIDVLVQSLYKVKEMFK